MAVSWIYDPSQYQEKNFEIIPQGDYRVRISEVTEKKFKSGNEGYEMTFEVNGYNSKVWFYLVLDANEPQKTNQRIGDFFDSFGITNPAMGTGKQWVGAVGAVRIKHEDYNGNKSAKVAYCLNRKNQEKLAPWKNGGAVGAAAAPAAPQVEIPSDLPFEM